MILAIDTGNTHTEIGLYEREKYLGGWRIATGVHRTEDELMAFIQQFLSFESIKPDAIQDIAIASVVPLMTRIIMRLSEKYFQLSPLIIDQQLDLGITVDYQPPGSVGADRLCNAVAAVQKYGSPSIIVDLGTATTLDVINRKRCYIGGVIAPGLETAAWGLHERTSKLPGIAFEFPERVIGRSTSESMQSGIMIGSVKMIDGLLAAVEAELGESAAIIATGGLSPVIAPHSTFIQHVEPHLVLDGLVAIYLRNR